MDYQDIAFQRLSQQRISQNQFKDPADIVRWLGAVQAQDYAGASWALGLRLEKATVEQVEAAFNSGKILRTHLMRPTWHFVTPLDPGINRPTIDGRQWQHAPQIGARGRDICASQ